MRITMFLIMALATTVASIGCRGGGGDSDFWGVDSDSDSDSDSDLDSDSDGDPEYPAEGIDVLLVVDNSGSMGEEQEILGNATFALVEGLVGDIDSVRVAVVSSDMGLQWGDNPYESGDGWPGDTPPGCGSVGDNGEFLTYGSGKTIYLGSDTYLCPGLTGDWAETDLETVNDELPGQAACLTSLGTNGCGWEQQLQSGAKALNRDDQADFTRDAHLLVVILVSDEEDCSIESNALFGTDEIQNLADGRVNIACGNHPDYLYEATSYKGSFEAPKDGNSNAVLFAAIVGVPPDDACEGRGNEIDNCLDHPDMDLEVITENDAYFFRPACDRWEGDVQVTKARPGRRFVELAQDFGENGYVFSICNADWTAAVDGIAQLIYDELDD